MNETVLPLLHAPSSTWFTASPDFGWLIVLYFFFAGLAGGCYLFAATIDLAGRPDDRPLARLGYFIALPCLVVCGLLLTFDLMRPERFWHLFLMNHTLQPMFKGWSPISIGSWALPVFGMFSALSFAGALAESGRWRSRRALRLRPPSLLGRVIAVLGALAGLYITGYTGVLLAVSNRPIWADTPLIGMLLVVSAASISSALMILVSRMLAWRLPVVSVLYRIDGWMLGLELLVLVGVVITLGPVARAWFGVWGALLALAVAMGIVVPLWLHRRHTRGGMPAMALAAVLVLIGGLLLRWVIVFSSEAISL